MINAPVLGIILVFCILYGVAQCIVYCTKRYRDSQMCSNSQPQNI